MKKYFFLVAAAITLAACSNDEKENAVKNEGLIRLTANIGAPMMTRTSFSTSGSAQNTQFVADKSIHVEAYLSGSSTPYSNGDYVTDGDGGMEGNLYYPGTLSTIDICAYYPNTVNYQTTSFPVATDQTTETAYQASDLMYATKLTNQVRTNSALPLTFNHAYSKVIVHLTCGGGVTNENLTNNVTAVKINGTKVGGSFAIANGAVGTITPTGNATDINITGAGINVTSQAGIIVPQTVAANTTFITVTYGGTDYTYALPEAKTFAPGYAYAYTLTLSTAGIELESEQITDWQAGTGDEPTLTL